MELSTSDIIVECGGDGEDLKVICDKDRLDDTGKASSSLPVHRLVSGIEKRLECDGGGGGGDSGEDAELAKDEELDRDGWEVIPADAAASMVEEDCISSDGEGQSSPSFMQR